MNKISSRKVEASKYKAKGEENINNENLMPSEFHYQRDKYGDNSSSLNSNGNKIQDGSAKLKVLKQEWQRLESVKAALRGSALSDFEFQQVTQKLGKHNLRSYI